MRDVPQEYLPREEGHVPTSVAQEHSALILSPPGINDWIWGRVVLPGSRNALLCRQNELHL